METFKRHRFSLHDRLYVEEETFEKQVFSDVQYHEYIELIEISQSPRIWIEKGELTEKFSEDNT